MQVLSRQVTGYESNDAKCPKGTESFLMAQRVRWHLGKYPYARPELDGGGMRKLKEKQKQEVHYEKSVIFVFIENPSGPTMVSLDKMGKLTTT